MQANAMLLRDISLDDPAQNVALDDILLARAEREGGAGFLRFWEAPRPFIVLGRISQAEDDLWLERVRQDLIPVIRRSSGGGTVIQGPGCLNYTLIMAKDSDPEYADLNRSYRRILGRLLEGIACYYPAVDFRPLSDMVLLSASQEERKFSGCAQRRGRHYFLHHGTLLYAFDLALMERYLRMPFQMPVYRRERAHREFVANIPLASTLLKKIIAGVFSTAVQTDILSDVEIAWLDRHKQPCTENMLSFR